jgi:hypothetical protein
MLKFTSVSGSVRAITDITLTGTIIRTGITLDLIMGPITGRTTGTAAIAIIAIIIVIPIITGASFDRNSHTGLARSYFEPAYFFQRKLTEDIQPHETRRVYLPYFGEAAGLVTGPLPGSSIWNSFLNC